MHKTIGDNSADYNINLNESYWEDETKPNHTSHIEINNYVYMFSLSPLIRQIGILVSFIKLYFLTFNIYLISPELSGSIIRLKFANWSSSLTLMFYQFYFTFHSFDLISYS